MNCDIYTSWSTMLKSLSGGGCPNKFTSSPYNYENDPEQEIYVSNPDQFPENNINDGDDNNYNEDEQLHENVNPYTYTYTYPSKQNFNTSSNSVSDSRPQYSRRLDPHLNTSSNSVSDSRPQYSRRLDPHLNTSSNSVSDSRPQYSRRLDPHLNTSSNSVSDSRPQYSRIGPKNNRNNINDGDEINPIILPSLNTYLNEEGNIPKEEKDIPNEEYFEEYFKELMQEDISNKKPNNKEFIYKHIDEINFNKSDLYLIMDYGKITGTDNIGNKLKKKLTSKYKQIK